MSYYKRDNSKLNLSCFFFPNPVCVSFPFSFLHALAFLKHHRVLLRAKKIITFFWYDESPITIWIIITLHSSYSDYVLSTPLIKLRVIDSVKEILMIFNKNTHIHLCICRHQSTTFTVHFRLAWSTQFDNNHLKLEPLSFFQHEIFQLLITDWMSDR